MESFKVPRCLLLPGQCSHFLKVIDILSCKRYIAILTQLGFYFAHISAKIASCSLLKSDWAKYQTIVNYVFIHRNALKLYSVNPIIYSEHDRVWNNCSYSRVKPGKGLPLATHNVTKDFFSSNFPIIEILLLLTHFLPLLNCQHYLWTVP